MNYEKILPMNYPVITSYPTHANILSCVTQYEDSMQWFYDYYIQLFGGRDVSQGCYMDFFAPIPWKSCPWINYQRISRDLIAKKWDSITEFFIECINSGYYLFLYLDQFHIPDSGHHQKYHSHANLIAILRCTAASRRFYVNIRYNSPRSSNLEATRDH